MPGDGGKNKKKMKIQLEKMKKGKKRRKITFKKNGENALKLHLFGV